MCVFVSYDTTIFYGKQLGHEGGYVDVDADLGLEGQRSTRESVKSSLDSVEPYRYIFTFLERMRGLLYRTSAAMNSVDPAIHAEQINSHMWDPLDSWG